jgi:hypothetical protein
MKIKKPYIIYSLPKSRTTQAFNRSKIDKAFEDTKIFLESCTSTNISNPDTLQLTAYTAYDSSDPSELLEDIIIKTGIKFGKAEVSPIAFHYPTGEPHTTNKYEWTLSNQRLQEAVNYIIENSPMPKSNFGPLELYLNYNFKWTAPKSKTELPNQDYVSSFGIWFSRGKACSPDLFFPFEEANQEFWNYLDTISKFFPFKLEERYLRIAHVNKQGEVMSFKKIERPLVER